jgi:general secretion pathway protein H
MRAMLAHRETRATRRRPRNRGFTLLELLVVIAIMSALTAVFPLALNRFVPARRVDAAARELIADIGLAEARSVASGKAVVIEPTGHGYRILTIIGTNQQAVAVRQWRASTDVSLQALNGAAVTDSLRVFADGSSTGGRFTIQDGERVRGVVVSELTGRVRLEVGAPIKADTR